MTIVGDRRNIVVVSAVTVGLLLGCFAVGVFAVRNTAQGLLLVGALMCVVVYLTGPQRMVWIALFLAFASLPASLHVGKVIGPVSIYAYQVAILLAIAFLIPIARLRFSAYIPPAILLLTVLFFAGVGIATGNSIDRVAYEATFLCELVAGYVLARLIVLSGYVRESIHVITVVLWVSAAMVMTSSLTGLELAGRAESLEYTTGSAQAIRLLTATQTPAIAVLAALVAAQIVGRGKPSTYLTLGVPALVVTLLAFSRNVLIVIAVTAGVALLASWRWSAIRRSAVLAAVGAALIAVVIPSSLYLLQNSAAGAWLEDQLNAFSHRVIGGVSSSALAVDSSTLSRAHENANLERAIIDAPLFGHGLGYAYQPPFGKPGTFTATLGTTYAHNFYLWWLVKAGAAGMVVLAWFALTPLIRALRSASAPARITAAVSAGLLVVCVVDPLPLNLANALTLGIALGAAAGFASARVDEPRT